MAQSYTAKYPHGASSTTFTYTTQAAISDYTAPTSLGAIGCLGQSEVSYIVDLDSVAGTPDSYALDVKLQYSLDGTNWTDLTGGAITQITSITQQTVLNKDITSYYAIRPLVRLTFVNGTSPTATFTITVNTSPNAQ